MSKKSMIQFADTMLSRSTFLRDYCRDLEEYVDPQAPLPISLLGYFGSQIAANFDVISPDEWATLSAMIEQGLASNDEDVGIAIATGLIEGLVHRAEAIENLWPRIEASLGSKARNYADAYRKSE
jgi:hypothetical protein